MAGHASPPAVLIDLAAPHPFWEPPPSESARLRARFPDVRWLAAPDGLAEAEVAFVWHIAREDAARATRLRWVHSAATGVRRLLHPVWRERGVTVTSSRGVQAPFVAEHVLALLLAEARALPEAIRAQAAGRWGVGEVLQKGPESLRGKRLFIVGYGAAGRELGRLVAPFAMEVRGLRRRGGGTEDGVTLVDAGALDGELAAADIVVNALPNTDATRAFFDARRLGLLAPGAVFVNVGRGETVDEDALAARLRDGKLRAALLDVFAREPLDEASPLWTAPGALVTPHVAGSARGIWPALIDAFAANLERWRDGRPLAGEVDWDLGY